MDTSGNTQTDSVTVTYVPPDTTPPTVNITSPSDGQYFDTNSITVSGTASDDRGVAKVEVSVSYAPYQQASGTTSWSKGVTLFFGPNKINAKATDTSGNTASASITANYFPPVPIPPPIYSEAGALTGVTTGIFNHTTTYEQLLEAVDYQREILDGTYSIAGKNVTYVEEVSHGAVTSVYPQPNSTITSNGTTKMIWFLSELENGEGLNISYVVSFDLSPMDKKNLSRAEIDYTDGVTGDIVKRDYAPFQVQSYNIINLSLSTSKDAYMPNETFILNGTVENVGNLDLSNLTFNGTVETPSGSLVAIPQVNLTPLPALSNTTFSITLNNQSLSMPGNYSLTGFVNSESGVALAKASTNFSVIEVIAAELTLSTNKPTYKQNETVDALARVKDTSPNTPLENASIHFNLSKGNATENEWAINLTTVPPLSQSDFHQYFAANATGNYTLLASLILGKDTLALANTSFEVLDATPPIVNLTTPLDGAFLRGSALVNGTIIDDNLANLSVEINGSSVANSLPYLWNTTSYPDGTYIVALSAVDSANNSAYDVVTVTVDNTPPQLNITTPLNLSYVRDYVVVNASILEANLDNVSLEIDGYEVAVALPFTWNTSAYSDGTHVIELAAYDKAGNFNSTTLSVTVDNTPPVASITAPINDSFLSRVVLVNGSAIDANLANISLRIDGIEASTSLPYSWDTSNYTDDTHAVELYAFDKAGNSASTSVVITTDNTAPAVQLTEPSNGSFIKQTIEINGTATDVNLLSTSLKIDGEEVSTGLPFSWDTSSYSDGPHVIELSATDRAYNNASTSITVIVDNTPPAVNLTSPNDGAFLGQTVTIDGVASDANMDSTSLKIDDVEFSTTMPYVWDTSAYADGSHTIMLSASDKAGNSANTSIAVIVDNTAPDVAITAPLNGSFMRQLVAINGSANDANLASLSLRIDGAEAATSLPYSWDTSQTSDGLHTLEIYASDLANNSASTSIVVTVDNTPPEITLTSPVNGSFVRQVVEISADVVEENLDSLSVKIDGVEASDTMPYSWDTSTYPDGTHALKIYAVDKAGNSASESVAVTVDNSPPALSILSPVDGSYLPTKDVELTWSGTDNYGISRYEILFDGQLLDTTAAASKSLPNLSEGVHQAMVKAYDLVNNSALTAVGFTIDTLPPQISITGIQNDSYYNADISASIEIRDANLNSSMILLDNAPYESGSTISVKGAHELAVYASDKAGNSASITLAFVIDKTPPAVVLTSPVNGSYSMGAITIDGSATDANLDSVALSVNGIAIAATLPYTWDTADSSDGPHLIELTARDKANNSGSTSVAVVVDNTPPDISVSSPLAQDYSYTKNITITYSVADLTSGVAFASASLDGAAIAAGETIDLSNFTLGKHVFTVEASDKVGNNASKTITFNVIDDVPPVVAIIEPTSREYATVEDITANFTAYDEKSGIASLTALIDGSPVANGQSIDLASLVLGEHSFTATAIDASGNSASESITFTLVATPVEIRVTPVAKNVKEDNNFDFMVHVSSGHDLSSLANATAATFTEGYTAMAVLYKEGNINIKVEVGVLESREYTFTLTSIGSVKVISNTANVTVFVPGEKKTEKGNSSANKTALKLQKRLTMKGELEAAVRIELHTVGGQQVEAVLVKEHIPMGLSIDTLDGIFTGYGLVWDVGRIENKETLEYTLRVQVDTPTTYELKTIVEYQTAEDLETLEEITYLTVEPSGKLKLKDGESKSTVKEKGRGFTKEQRGRAFAGNSGGDSGEKDRGKSGEHRQDDKAHENGKGGGNSNQQGGDNQGQGKGGNSGGGQGESGNQGNGGNSGGNGNNGNQGQGNGNSNSGGKGGGNK